MAASRGDLLLAAGGVLGLIALGLAAVMGVNAFQRNRAAAEEASIQSMAKRSILLGALKENFPQDYSEIEKLVRQSDRTGQSSSAVRETIDRRIIELIRAKTHYVATASDEAMSGIARPQLDYVKFLSDTDTGMCSRYNMTGLNAADLKRVRLSSGMKLDQLVTAAMLHAARDGFDHQQRRVSSTVSPTTARAIIDRMQRDRVRPALVARITSITGLNGASPTDQCEGGLAISRAIASLSPHVGGEYYRAQLKSIH